MKHNKKNNLDIFLYSRIHTSWFSSVGRASDCRSGGQRFDPGYLLCYENCVCEVNCLFFFTKF